MNTFPINPIKIIINTYDKQLVFGRLIYLQYEELFDQMKKNLNLDPNLQIFEYYIPYQSEDNSDYQWLREQQYVKMIKTGRTITDTIKTLIKDIPDTEMVYWAIDDRIPFWFDEEAFYSLWLKINEFNHNHTKNKVGRVSMGFWADKDERKDMQHQNCSCPKSERKIGNTTYHGYSQRSIAQRFWQHHYVQAQILRYMFVESGASKEAGPGVYSYILKWVSREKHPIPKKYQEVINSNFFPEVPESLIQFYESTKGRENKNKRKNGASNIPVVLKNAKKLLEKHNLPIPTFGDEDCFVGGRRGDQYLISLKKQQ
jgi:hypothetical protein